MLLALGALVALAAGCEREVEGSGASRTNGPVPAKPAGATQAATGKHATAHGGSLNAIVSCELGHAEVIRDGDRLTVWFVGGGSRTRDAQPVADRTILLAISLPGKPAAGKGLREAKMLELKPLPLALAGEKVGACSRFEATAPWLASAERFVAVGNVRMRGATRPLRIEYPGGYDPD